MLGFCADCFNFAAVIAESFFAVSVLKATEFQMGVLGGCAALGYALPCIWTGLLSERFGRLRMIVIACVGMTLMYAAAPFSPTIYILCLVSFLRAVSVSFLWPPAMAWMAETSERESFPRLLGRYNISWALGLLSGFYVGGWVFEHIGPRSPFFFAAGLCLAMLAFVLVCTPVSVHLTVQDHDMEAGDVAYYVRQGLLMLLLGNLISALVLYMFPKLMQERMGEAQQSALQASRMAGQAALFIIFTHTRAWHFRRWPVWLAVLSYACGVAIIASARAYGVFVVGFALVGCGMGVSFMMCSYYTLALMKSKGLGSGIQETLVGLGNFLGPLYGGTVAWMTNPRVSVLAAMFPIAIISAAAQFLRSKQRIR